MTGSHTTLEKIDYEEVQKLAKSLINDHNLLPNNIVHIVKSAIAKVEHLQIEELTYLLKLHFSEYWLRKQNYKNAKGYAESALTLALSMGNLEQITNARINLANIYSNTNELSDALTLLTHALNNHPPSQKLKIYISLAVVFTMMQKNEVALEYFEKALQELPNPNNPKYTFIHINIGFLLCQLERYNEAFHSINTALAICKNKPSGKRETAICLANIADIKFAQKDYVASIDCLNQSIELYEDLQMPEAKINALLVLAKAHAALEEYTSAYQILKETLQTFSKNNYLRLYIDGLNKIISVTKKLNKFKECIAYQEELIEIQSEYFYPEKKDKIEALLNKKEEEIDVLIVKNQKIEKQNQQLQQYNKELEQYAFIIAHDLKEPLCNISGFTSLLKKKQEQDSDSEITNYLQYIESGAQHMHQLLEDLLRYSILQIDPTKIQSVTLPNLIQEAFEAAKESLSSKFSQKTLQSAQLSIINPLPTLQAESEHIQWLINHLIENALKFGHPDRVHHISIRSYQQNTKTFIEIQDNGIGIEKAYQDKIFRIFQRLHKNTYNGTGIGLAMCKKIVELYNGEIGMESEIGVGTRVYFCLNNIS